MNFAYVGALIVGLMLTGLGSASAAASREKSVSEEADPTPRVVVAIVPSFTTVESLREVDDLVPGLVNVAIGTVWPAQVYVDISQGNRISSVLYESEPPSVSNRGRFSPGLWREIVDRAQEAPGELRPGLLASTLEAAQVPRIVDPDLGRAALIAADEEGRVRRGRAPACKPECRPGLTVVLAAVSDLPALASGLERGDLLIALPRATSFRRLVPIGFVGSGYDGEVLTSATTRMPGLVAATDLAPTILGRLGLPVPGDMNGQPVRAVDAGDGSRLADLQDRLTVKNGRRGSVVGRSLLGWFAVVALVALAGRRRAARVALPILALSIVYLPLVLCLLGPLNPTSGLEWLAALTAPPALGALTLWLIPGYRGLAVACAATAGVIALDMLLDLDLVERSILGPNLAAGGRFFGLNNEFEAILAAIVPIGVGSGLAGSRLSHRHGAAVFLLAGLAATAVFALGRFGADVGAAIVFPAGAGVAVAVLVGTRRAALLAMLLPLAGVSLLVVADLLLGGSAHLTRSVLEANGSGEITDVIERRIRQAVGSFSRTSNVVVLPVVALLVAFGAIRWRAVRSWLREPPVLAGFAGAVVATAVGTVANDSGAIMLIFGIPYAAALVGFAWAHSNDSRLLPRPAPERTVTSAEPPVAP